MVHGHPSDASWTIRKVYSIRSLGQSLIQYRIGDVLGTSLWLDNWHPLGPLYNRFGNDVVFTLGRSSHLRCLLSSSKGI